MPVPGPAVKKKLPSASQWPSQTRPRSPGLHRRAPAATIFHPSIRVNIQEVRPPKELMKEAYQETLQLRLRWQLFSNSINSLTLTYHHHGDRTDCTPGPLQTGIQSSDGKGIGSMLFPKVAHHSLREWSQQFRRKDNTNLSI